jgi:hypothetical protein|tara:strand:+ start:570 stop:1199 length:630 start_codon:yes stop_codon:yes gene_type:complete
MQLSAIKTNILDNCGLAADDPRFPTATIDRIVNRATRRVAAEHDWPWNQATSTINTVADTQTSTFPASAKKIIRLEQAGRDLISVQGREGGQHSQESGRPGAYWIEADTIYWAPVPDGVYAVHCVYHGVENPLGSVAGGANDTDTPNLPDQYIDFLIAHASILIATTIRDTELFGMADQERKMWLRRMHDDVRRTSSPQKVKTRRDWWI